MLPPSAHQLTLLQTIWPSPQDNILDYLKFEIWTPAYLADFPSGAWTWNHQLSPIQYATSQFPQLLSAFDNDVAVNRTDSGSLFYRKTYPGAGWEKVASSNSTAYFPWPYFSL